MGNDSHEIFVIIQARLKSVRLPGKAMKDLAGQPVLGHVIDRVKQAIANIIVATPDMAIADYAMTKNCFGFIGSETDVLDRYYQAAKTYGVDTIVRVCSDNPLCDPAIIERILNIYLTNEYDYVSNTIQRTYPVGLDVEVFSFHALERAAMEADRIYDREHVTPYIYTHPEWFDVYNLRHSRDLSELRWCIDTQEDFDRITGMYARMGDKPLLHFQDILELTGELCVSAK